MYEYRRANVSKRLVRQIAGTQLVGWLARRTLHHIDRSVHRLTKGRTTFSAWVSGLPVVMLTTTGAKTGRQHTRPVLGIPDGERLILIGSNFGQPHNPAWYHNLRANPRASVTVDGVRRIVDARELTGEERDRHFERGLQINPGWARYRQRAANRRIPVISLDPAPDDAATPGAPGRRHRASGTGRSRSAAG